MDKRTRKYIINIALIFALSALVIYFSLKDDFNSVVGLLASVKLPWLLACIGLALLYHVVVGYILREFARMIVPKFPLKYGLINAMIAALFHGLTPFSSGGQFVQVYVFHKHKIKMSDSASLLLMDFILYQATLVFYTFFLILVRFTHIASSQSIVFKLAFFGFLINVVVIVGLLLLAKSERLHQFITHQGLQFLVKMKFIKNPDNKIRLIDENVKNFRIELARLSNHKALMVKVIVANVIRLTIFNSIPFFACLSLGVSLGWSGWIDLLALSAFVSMVTAFIPLPGASGGTEGTYIIMFQAIFSNFPSSIAVGSMLIWRFATFHLIMIIGLFLFVAFKRHHSIKKIEEELYENRTI